jgi:hypothetical protein
MKIKVLVPLLSLLAIASSHAATVITINIANPSAVIITALSVNSAVTGNLDVNFNGGISLRNFFTANESITLGSPLAISGNWTSRGTTSAFNEMVTFAFGNANVVPGVDLSIYNVDAPNGDDQNLLSTDTAFTGTATIDMSGFTHMPAVGATGDVNLGYLGSQGGVIGTYSVIPEPSAAMLGLVGMVALFLRRR